ncbi:MAG: hypothetical protein HY335_00085 [Deinococcus sp.]|nr:hypothetical protein [Deinococcus sp.]
MKVTGALAVASLMGSVMLGGVFAQDQGYNPLIDPANFVRTVDNPFFPLTPGTTFVYEAITPEGTERVEVFVTPETKDILGVTCTVVRDTVTLDGELVEDTLDWYAQDRDGNVWYFGESARNYEDGVLVSTEGSWEAGVDGAKPGIIMEANPQVGDRYRQEYYVGVAEDMAAVVSLTESVTVPYGSFTNCLKTEDFTPLDPSVIEYKFYCSGVGQVLTLEGNVRSELISINIETPS